MTHDDIAELVFSVLNECHSSGIHDTLRQSHAVAVALKLTEDGHASARAVERSVASAL